MRPAFSNALYYPTIDIENTDWLKTAIFFWDSISTIVPESLNHPYNQTDTEYLADIGFLRPLLVNSNDKSVIGIEEDILSLMRSPEFYQAIRAPGSNHIHGIWRSKLSHRVRENLAHFRDAGIYPEKMSPQIRKRLQPLNWYSDKGEVYPVDRSFAYAYMVTLASKLCEDHSLGMITDDIPCFNVGNAARLGNQTTMLSVDGFHNRRPSEHQFEQGLLLDFIIKGISISPDTTLDEIVSFKNHHKDELGRFRTQLAKLTQNFTESKSIDVVQQETSDLYENEFLPAFNDFKAALNGSRIKWFTETFFKVSLLSASTTGIPMALLGMPTEQAIFAGAGASIIASLVSYNVDKKKTLRENPYAYLLSISNEWA